MPLAKPCHELRNFTATTVISRQAKQVQFPDACWACDGNGALPWQEKHETSRIRLQYCFHHLQASDVCFVDSVGRAVVQSPVAEEEGRLALNPHRAVYGKLLVGRVVNCKRGDLIDSFPHRKLSPTERDSIVEGNRRATRVHMPSSFATIRLELCQYGVSITRIMNHTCRNNNILITQTSTTATRLTNTSLFRWSTSPHFSTKNHAYTNSSICCA